MELEESRWPQMEQSRLMYSVRCRVCLRLGRAFLEDVIVQQHQVYVPIRVVQVHGKVEISVVQLSGEILLAHLYRVIIFWRYRTPQNVKELVSHFPHLYSLFVGSPLPFSIGGNSPCLR